MKCRERLTIMLKLGIAAASTAALMHIYQPRLEERKARLDNNKPVVEIVESTQALWTVQDVSEFHYRVWEVDQEPVIDDGFVKFVYGPNYDYIWVHATNARIYRQDYR